MLRRFCSYYKYYKGLFALDAGANARFPHSLVVDACGVKLGLDALARFEFLEAHFGVRMKVAAHADDVVLQLENRRIDVKHDVCSSLFEVV